MAKVKNIASPDLTIKPVFWQYVRSFFPSPVKQLKLSKADASLQDKKLDVKIETGKLGKLEFRVQQTAAGDYYLERIDYFNKRGKHKTHFEATGVVSHAPPRHFFGPIRYSVKKLSDTYDIAAENIFFGRLEIMILPNAAGEYDWKTITYKHLFFAPKTFPNPTHP